MSIKSEGSCDDAKQVNVEEAYESWSDSYDTDRNPTRDLDVKITREILAEFRDLRILELGCGTGKNTAFLAGIGKSVLALDFSDAMLRKAREKIAAENVTFVAADLTAKWPVTDDAFDLVVCNLVLEHIEDLSFIFAQASRCLMSEGHFFVSELHPFRQYLGTKANFQRHNERVSVPAFVHHLSDYLQAAEKHGLMLKSCREWWHQEDENKPPRLVSFLFAK